MDNTLGRGGLFAMLAIVVAMALFMGAACSPQNLDATSDEAAASDSRFDAALSSALDYARGQADGIAQGTGAEWLALSLARAGDDPSAPPLSDFAAAMEARTVEAGGVLDEHASTEYSKAILALTALGVDPRDVAGYNLFAGLSDMDFIQFQGINGPIWALVALNSSPAYEIPAAADGAQRVDRDSLVDAVLAAQGADGGWPYTGVADDPGSVDLTAMAVTALALLASEGEGARADVQEAVNRALAFLSDAQAPGGGYDGGDGECSESAAQVVIALCALGIDPGTDERFIKDGASVLDSLLGFQTEDGGFSHLAGNPTDGVATNQACEALVAVFRLRNAQTPLYDMSA